MYACLAVTCHLRFWQNDRGLLRATAVTRGWNGYRNKSQHRKLTLEKKILPPLLQGFEPATFRSRVRRSNHWAIPAPQRRALPPVLGMSGANSMFIMTINTFLTRWIPLCFTLWGSKRYTRWMEKIMSTNSVNKTSQMLQRRRVILSKSPSLSLPPPSLLWQFTEQRASVVYVCVCVCVWGGGWVLISYVVVR